MAFLQITSDDQEKVRKFEFDRDEITIGRLPDNTIKLDDPSVSGKHCVVLRDGRKYTVRDLGATNQTRLNNMRITESRLRPKDIIMVGSVAVMFDGSDVETDKSVSTPSGTRLTVTPGAPVPSSPIDGSSPFITKRETKWIWITVIAIVIIVTAAAGCLFLFRLFKS